MKISDTIIACISSARTTLVLLMTYAILLGIATWIEKDYGTNTAERIYHHPATGVLWVLLIVNWMMRTARNRIHIKQKTGYYLLHTSFVFIISGAFLSHYTGIEGMVHVREGEQTNIAYTREQKQFMLPFQIYLNDFQLIRYPGSNSPRSYKSIVTIYEKNANAKTEIYMNKVVSVQNYRLFQTAYDEDEAGTILTVSYDPIGMKTTYTGYVLLFIGIILLPFQKQSRLRTLIGRLKYMSVLLFIPFCTIQAQTDWSHIQVQNSNGRIEPLDTYCRTLVRKIHHGEHVDTLTATAFVLDLLARPDFWNNQPIIYQPNKEIQQMLKQKGKYISFNDLFDKQGNYLLSDEVNRIYGIPSQQHDKRQKDLLKLDERVNILLTLEQGKLLPLFPLPEDGKQRWFSPGDDLSEFSGEDSLFVSHIMPWYFSEPKQEIVDMISIYQHKRTNCPLLSDKFMKLEQIYNRIRPFQNAAFGYLFGGLLLLAFVLIQTVRLKEPLFKGSCKVAAAIILCFFLLHTTGLIVRWLIGGQAPWSNAYESMIYAAWCTLGGSLIFVRRSFITLALATFFAGIILLVAHMNQMDPAITPLVPVLQSYWLTIHVAVIMGGYGFLAIGFLLGLTGLSLMALPHSSSTLKKKLNEMATINEISLLLGLSLMTAGTFLGAIWANEAWGRYWGWDPKETWALITILVYTAIIHARFIPKFNNEFVLFASSVWGFSSVLMTYLGVNYYLTGMHSYGSGNAPFEIYIFAIIYLAITVLCMLAFRKFASHPNTL